MVVQPKGRMAMLKPLVDKTRDKKKAFQRYIHILNDITLQKAHTILLHWVTWSNENNIQSLIIKPLPYG